MTLQASGPISMGQIKAELGSASYSLRVYSSASKVVTNDVKFDIPDALSDFYSYPPGTTTTTTTTTAAPAQATFTGFVSIVDTDTACAGGEYGLVTITVYGTNLCDATSVRSLSSVSYGNVYGDFGNNETFYIARLSNTREFQRNGSAENGTPQTACVSCPTTTTTEAPTTTTTTTAAPCECWTIVNEGAGTGNYSYDRCSDGTTLNRNINSGVTQTVCAKGGTNPFANTGTLTLYPCGTPCNTNPNCAAC